MDDPPTVQPRLGNKEFASDLHPHCSTAAFKGRKAKWLLSEMSEICKFVFFINKNHVDTLSCDYHKKLYYKTFFSYFMYMDVWLFCTTVFIMMQKEVCDDAT